MAHETSAQAVQLEASALSTPRDRLQTPAADARAQPTETPRAAGAGARADGGQAAGGAPGAGARGDLVRGMVARRTMRDWVDLEHAVGNKGLRDSILNFSYFLTIGNMDEALKVMSNVRGCAALHSLRLHLISVLSVVHILYPYVHMLSSHIHFQLEVCKSLPVSPIDCFFNFV